MWRRRRSSGVGVENQQSEEELDDVGIVHDRGFRNGRI